MFLHRKGTDHEYNSFSYIYKVNFLSKLVYYLLFYFDIFIDLLYIPLLLINFIYLLIIFNGYRHIFRYNDY